MYLSLPTQGYKSITGDPALDGWTMEFIDAIGIEIDKLWQVYCTSLARQHLLDPTYVSPLSADNFHATNTQAPAQAPRADSMLDLLAYACGYPFPLDSQLTTAQRRALVNVDSRIRDRKGTRILLLALASAMSDGVAYGWTTPPFQFSVILPDGAPSPGWGSWAPPYGSTSLVRPWLFQAMRDVMARFVPAFTTLGIGYSQFRAGYSGAGEPVLPTGARLNLLANGNFSDWTTGVPNSWNKSGAGTLTQGDSNGTGLGDILYRVNTEFTRYAPQFDLSAAAAAVSLSLDQTTQINNQIGHRVEIDYNYTNPQNANTLWIEIYDINDDGNTYYYDGTSWKNSSGVSFVGIPLPVSVDANTRTRFGLNLTPQSASNSTALRGQRQLKLVIKAKSDGTATTQTIYTIYRAGVYELFDVGVELAAAGERTAWLPLGDAQGWTNFTRTSSGVNMVEIANASRSAYKVQAVTTLPMFEYHPALTGRGFRSNIARTNLLKGSSLFDTDWTRTNATITINAYQTPNLATDVSAPLMTATNTGASVQQGSLGTPTSKDYIAGVWVKKISPDNNFTDVTLSLSSGATVKSYAFTATQAQGWVLLAMPRQSFGGGDVTALQFKIAWGAASSSGQIALASAYVIEVTGSSGDVLYLPITQSSAGSAPSLNTGTLKVTTDTVDTNVLHPLIKRTMASVVRGELLMTIVPSFGTLAGSINVPNAYLFDLAQDGTHNRISLRISSNFIKLEAFDNAGNTQSASIECDYVDNPGSGKCTYRRDTAISIIARWRSDGSLFLSAGNGSNSIGAFGGWSASDTSVATMRIGCDRAGANQFEGLISGVEVVQVGQPAS